MSVILRLDARDSSLRQLLPGAADRIEASAREHQPEVDAAQFAGAAMAKIWNGDPNVLLLVIVKPETAELVGHVLAERNGDTIIVAQAEADGREREQQYEAVRTHVAAWARDRQVTRLLLSRNGDGKQWEKKLGAKFYRHVLMLSLDSPVAHDESPTSESVG